MAFSSLLGAVSVACLTQAVGVAVDAQSRIIRRQSGEEAEAASAVLLGSAGEMLRIRSTDEDVRAPPHNTAAGIPEDPGDSHGQFCKSDFLLGEDKENDCMLGNHTNVADRRMCLYAAHKAGFITDVSDTDAIEDIGYDLHEKRPWGCFMKACDATTSGKCYFWNDAPAAPNNIQDGTPVCRRAYYAWGTAKAGDITNGCPGGYTPVVTEGECEAARRCNTMETGHPNFRVGTEAMSDVKKYPLGCFFLRSTTEPFQDDAYFNPLDGPDATLATHGPDAGVSGTPICKVKHSLKFQ
jgi:hypothetical protein